MAKLVVIQPKEKVSNDMQILAGHISACTQCALHTNRVNAVVGRGPIDARIMIIGEAPGQTENDDNQGRPFIGRAGRELTSMLLDAGISIGDCYITNMVKCWPGEGNPDPLAEEIDACAPWLTKQMEIVRPRGTITLGRFSTSRWIDWTTMGAVQGSVRRVAFEGWSTLVCPIYHPAYILRNRAERDTSVQHLRNFAKLLRT